MEDLYTAETSSLMGRFLRLNTTAGARNSAGGMIEITGFKGGIRIVIGEQGKTVRFVKVGDRQTYLVTR